MKNSLLANFDGPIVMIGFGSIGKGTLRLLERHIAFDRSKFVVIAPDDRNCHLLEERQIRFMRQAITRDNYRESSPRCSRADPAAAWSSTCRSIPPRST